MSTVTSTNLLSAIAKADNKLSSEVELCFRSTLLQFEHFGTLVSGAIYIVKQVGAQSERHVHLWAETQTTVSIQKLVLHQSLPNVFCEEFSSVLHVVLAPGFHFHVQVVQNEYNVLKANFASNQKYGRYLTL